MFFAPLRFRSRDGYWLQGPMCQGQERLEANEDFDSRMVSMNDDPYMTVRSAISESFESIRMVKYRCKSKNLCYFDFISITNVQ